MQATLYAQIRTLTTDLKARYVDFEISVHDSLYPWIVRHAQWLINRYLQKAGGLTAFEKRWNRKDHGSICNFGKTIMFRVSNAGKSQLSWHEGIWLGRDTESDMHFVADSSGVFKSRSIRRNIPSQQAKLEFLQSIKSTPWDPSGSKRETDAFILPLSKDEQQSQGAQKEDYEPSIAPEDQQKTFRTCLPQGATLLFLRKHLHHEFGDMKKFLPMMTLFLDLVLIPLLLWIGSMSMNRKKPDVVPRFSDFPEYFSMLRSFEFHPLRPSMDLRFLFRLTRMKKNFC